MTKWDAKSLALLGAEVVALVKGGDPLRGEVGRLGEQAGARDYWSEVTRMVSEPTEPGRLGLVADAEWEPFGEELLQALTDAGVAGAHERLERVQAVRSPPGGGT